MNFNSLKSFYTKDLQERFLPFWKRAMDLDNGGVFTCYVNDGSRLISERKYIWSQGRFLWLCSHLLMQEQKGNIHLTREWNNSLEKTHKFLKKNALMANNHAVFALEKNGEKILDQLDTSIFADCFYVLGCNSYAYFKENKEEFEEALKIYDVIKKRIKTNRFQSEPYPIPTGYRSHSIPMILINLALELFETAEILGHSKKQLLIEDIESLLNEIIMELSNDLRIKEMMPEKIADEDSLLERHVNPGHTLESIWFMLHSIDKIDSPFKQIYVDRLCKIAENTLNIGWDAEYGGLLRFVDKNGGLPIGESLETPYEKMILDTWDTKLWWPHAEALYTTLLLFDKTGEEKWLNWYKKIESYVFATFPNKDLKIGEWIQIRERDGSPLEKVVALPVKDPFHIIRSYLLIIELTERMEAHASRL